MAASRERPYESRYDDGGGGFGKFRKRPVRRLAATPYDRHPPAVPVGVLPGSGGQGWLSKLVDPAQRLIASGAHRLFASVFRKRITQPPPSSSAESIDTESKRLESKQHLTDTVEKPFLSPKEKPNGYEGRVSSYDGASVSELEHALKQQTFTKSEIERLTSLLRSKFDGQDSEDLARKPDAASPMLTRNLKDGPFETPLKGNEKNYHVNASSYTAKNDPVQGDIATPAEVAKAYMGGRPSFSSLKSISSVGVVHANAHVDSNSPIMGMESRSIENASLQKNGFATPRSIGRSALYGMVRTTPYSRGYVFNPIQSGGPFIYSSGGASPSQDGGSNKTLKRRISVLESDTGAVGPIRRIRQKSNLLPTSGIMSGRGYNLSQPKEKKDKGMLAVEPVENGDRATFGFNSVPSKSSEMASKIFQQLDTIVSTREKSPSKLSPSMLRGPALRSLENLESSKLFLPPPDESNQVDGHFVTSLPAKDAEDAKIRHHSSSENGCTQPIMSYNKSVASVSDVDSNSATKVSPIGIESSKHSKSHLSKKRGFQMSANEDYFELDDGDDANGSADIFTAASVQPISPPSSEQKLPTVAISNGNSYGSLLNSSSQPDRPPKATLQNESNVNVVLEASDTISHMKDPVGSNLKTSVSNPNSFVPEPNGQPSATHFGSSTSLAQQNSTSFGLSTRTTDPIAGFGQKILENKDKTPEIPAMSSPSSSFFSFGESANTSSLSNSSLASFPVSSSSVTNNMATTLSNPTTTTFTQPISSSINSPEYKFGVFSSSSVPLTTVSTESSLAASESKESKINGQISSFCANPFSGGSFSGTQSNPIGDVPSSTSGGVVLSSSVGTSSTGLFGHLSSTSATATSPGLFGATSSTGPFGNFTTASTGLFGSSSSTSSSSLFGNTTSDSTLLFSGTSSSTSSSTGCFGGTTFPSTTTAAIFGGTSSAGGSTSGNATFSFGSGVTSSSGNQIPGFNPFIAKSNQTSSSKESSPFQFGSTGSSSSIDITGTTGFSSANSLVTSSHSDKLFGHGNSLGISSSSSESSSSSSVSPIFGSNWQSSKSSMFGSSSNSCSSGLVFGSTTSNSATTTLFGSTSSASIPVFGSNVTTGSSFTFSSPVTSSPLPKVFGSTNLSATSASPSHGEHMNMEDTMAEDMVHPTSAVPVFGQPQQPSSSFVFGSGTQSSVNQFVSTPNSSTPFQFGGQPSMPIQSNPSPFQATGSLEFQASGSSFSLGTNGGDKSNRRIVKVKKPLRKR